jgi:hypothetical protein
MTGVKKPLFEASVILALWDLKVMIKVHALISEWAIANND